MLREAVRGEQWKRMLVEGVTAVRMRADGGAWEWAAPAALVAYFLEIILVMVALRSVRRSSLRLRETPESSALYDCEWWTIWLRKERSLGPMRPKDPRMHGMTDLLLVVGKR